MNELEPIRKKLAALRGKVMTALLVDGGARVAMLLLAVITVSFALDRFFKLEFGARGVLLLAGLAALGYAIRRFVVRRVLPLVDFFREAGRSDFAFFLVFASSPIADHNGS